MDQELLVRQIMQEVLKNMQASKASAQAAEGAVTVADYPIGENKPELIKSASGKSLDELTLEGVIKGELTSKDFRITKEHGIWTEKKGIWYMPTYHPAALLRDESKKKDQYAELLQIT